IETLAERLIPSHASWESLRQAFAEALAASRSRGAVGFKSIAAYRTGLDVERVDAAAAGAALAAVRAGLEEETPLRLTSKPLIDALIWEAMEVASELGLPIQFHVGLGDDDVFLPRANPTLLQALFQEPRYSGVPIVLLHCYPYVREAAYLSSIYPNAYTDLGLTVPLAGPDCAPLLRAALGLAPTTKVLASTDGHGLPEFQWFAAHLWRDALARVLADLVAEGWLSDADAPRLAAMVLHGNAELIYPA
ncbi:MAG: amidohydrolase family protein, partial [Thermomicrobiaceae bacterium]|nr:amidohydrolase family protein [Thermomicrobiaceae bacterium]